MAEKDRRDEDAADDRLDDEAFDDAVDDDAIEDDGEGDEPVSRGGTATRSRKKADPADKPAKAKKDTGRVGVLTRIGRFFREVVAELRKVIWPTRKELLTYTSVVLVFVVAMVTIVGLFDFAFGQGVIAVFGA